MRFKMFLLVPLGGLAPLARRSTYTARNVREKPNIFNVL